MKHMRSMLGAGLLALPLALATQGQAALSVDSLVVSGSPNSLLSDNSADFFINVDGSTSTNGTPTVTQGDIIFNILGINTIEPGGGSSTTIGSGTDYSELTAITAVKIDQMADIDYLPFGPDDSTGTQNIDLYQYLAVPLSASDATYFDWSTGKIDLNGDGTAEFTFNTGSSGVSNDDKQFSLWFEDDSQDYDRTGTVQTGLTSATNGDLKLALEMIAANGDFLSVVAPLDLGQIAALAASSPSTAIDNTNISADGTISQQYFSGGMFYENITGGNGGFSTPSAGSDWPAFDNLDFTLTPVPAVPEPGTIILMGFGLVGLAGIARKRMMA